MLDQLEIIELNEQLHNADPKEILNQLVELIPNTAISFSGAEDVLLIEFTQNQTNPPPIFTLDTGRLHTETSSFIEEVKKHYNRSIEALLPNQTQVNKLINNKGLYSFYEDGHEECCNIRKVEPLRKKLKHLDAWITGQRRDQSPARAEVAVIEIDQNFSSADHQVIKINPLANWSSAKVWQNIRLFKENLKPTKIIAI